MIILSVKIDMS